MLSGLTVVSIQFVIGLFVLTVAVALWAAHPTQGRWRWRRRAPWAAAALVLTLTSVADTYNAYYSYLPDVSDVADAVTQRQPPRLTTVLRPARPAAVRPGRLARLAMPPDHSGVGSGAAWVWLPAQYFEHPEQRFPVVYLFHGSPGMPSDWFHAGRAGRIARHLSENDQPVIEVAPLMSRNWTDDPECVDGLRESVETHLLDDVIPTVDRSLRTIPTRDGRIFAGMSAGGYCALNLGLRHREIVSTIFYRSRSLDLTSAYGFVGAARQRTM